MASKGKVVVTSRSFSNHPVLRQELLAKHPNTTFNEAGLTLVGEELKNFLDGYDQAIIAMEKIDRELLSCLPELQHISKYGVGLNNIDQDAMKTFGKTLACKSGVNKRSVAELALCFMLTLLRHVQTLHQAMKVGEFSIIKGEDLSEKTIGLIGCGNIGQDLAKLLQPFNCNLLVSDPVLYSDFYEKYHVTPVSLKELLKRADIVSIHAPLTQDTLNLINQPELSMLKTSAILINTARGGIVNESALLNALLNRELAGAGLDVFSTEPPCGSPLLGLTNVITTPHIGGSTEQAILAMGRAAIEGLNS